MSIRNFQVNASLCNKCVPLAPTVDVVGKTSSSHRCKSEVRMGSLRPNVTSPCSQQANPNPKANLGRSEHTHGGSLNEYVPRVRACSMYALYSSLRTHACMHAVPAYPLGSFYTILYVHALDTYIHDYIQIYTTTYQAQHALR